MATTGDRLEDLPQVTWGKGTAGERIFPWPTLGALALRHRLVEIEKGLGALQREWDEVKALLDVLEADTLYVQRPTEHLLREEP